MGRFTDALARTYLQARSSSELMQEDFDLRAAVQDTLDKGKYLIRYVAAMAVSLCNQGKQREVKKALDYLQTLKIHTTSSVK